MLCRTIERHFTRAEKISFTSHYCKGAFAHWWSPDKGTGSATVDITNTNTLFRPEGA